VSFNSYAARVVLYAFIAAVTSILTTTKGGERYPDWVDYLNAAVATAITLRAFIDRSPSEVDAPKGETP
jgi:hypothetical protein